MTERAEEIREAIPPLALSNLIRAAFFAGAGYGDMERISDEDQKRYVEFGWSGYGSGTLRYFEDIEKAIAAYNSDRSPHPFTPSQITENLNERHEAGERA